MSEVLIIGSGGREYELGRAVYASDEVDAVNFLPGNAGTGELNYGRNITGDPLDLSADTFVIIGPEAPLVAGEADRLREKGRLVFGPSAAAARLEASKAEAVLFMRENDISQPISTIVTNPVDAIEFLRERKPTSYVIKADGLAGGKGVVLPDSMTEALNTVNGMMDGTLFDGAGKDCIVFQERLTGPEVSLFVISDGSNFTLLPLAQDHKRLYEGDRGPNTGGMGAYAPANQLLSERQMEKAYGIAEKSIKGMEAKGTPYQGVLYIGLMLAEERGGDPVVIEYNCRFGDPETEVVLPLLEQAGVNIHHLLRSSAEGQLHLSSPTTLLAIGGAALTVCLAAPGYPDKPEKGGLIKGLDSLYDDVIIHHAGTAKQDGEFVTSGGRVLYVTGFGENMDEAAERAYAAVGGNGVHFTGMQYRKDIGHQLRTR